MSLYQQLNLHQSSPNQASLSPLLSPQLPKVLQPLQTLIPQSKRVAPHRSCQKHTSLGRNVPLQTPVSISSFLSLAPREGSDQQPPKAWSPSHGMHRSTFLRTHKHILNPFGFYHTALIAASAPLFPPSPPSPRRSGLRSPPSA